MTGILSAPLQRGNKQAFSEFGTRGSHTYTWGGAPESLWFATLSGADMAQAGSAGQTRPAVLGRRS